MHHKYLGGFLVSVAGMMVVFGLHQSCFPGAVAQGVTQSSGAGTGDENARSLKTRALYKTLCQKCHGDDGTGGAARDQFKGIPDFTNAGWQTKRSNIQLRVSILEGRGTHMPSFADKMGAPQAADLVGFIRLFAPTKKE